jgi:hypothetical protein
MIKPHAFHDMRINEKGYFGDKVLAAIAPYCERDAELALLVAAASIKNQQLARALQKISCANITKQMKKDDSLRDHGIVNLRSYAQVCAGRKNPTWAQAGQLVVDAIKQVGWGMNRKGNNEETKLVDTLLAELDNQPKLREAIATINGQEWVDEIREGHASYKLHDLLRDDTKEAKNKVNSKQAAQELCQAINKLFRYINFQVEFRDSEPYRMLASSLNTIIAESKVTLKQRATRAKKRKEPPKDGTPESQ